MKVEKREIPEEMKKTIVEVSPKNKEKSAASLLDEIRSEEESRRKDNRKAIFFVNLIYLISLSLFGYMTIYGKALYAIPALALVTLGAFVFNLFIYNESKRTKKKQEAIETFYREHGSQKAN